jgi:hypothetical protein
MLRRGVGSVCAGRCLTLTWPLPSTLVCLT